MKVELTPENEENIRRLSIMFDAAIKGIVNHFINTGLKLVERDLKDGVPEKYKILLKQELARLKKSPWQNIYNVLT